MAERVIVDPSVAAKWYLPDERDVDVADQWFVSMSEREAELLAPDLFYDEVAHALLKAASAHTPRLSKPSAMAFFFELLDYPLVRLETLKADRLRAFQLAAEHSKVYYDMVYLALAERLNCRWLTADERILKSSGPEFPAERVWLLGGR